MTFTLGDMEAALDELPAGKLYRHLAMWKFSPLPYDEWADLVEEALAKISVDMTGQRHYLQKQSEDALTTSVLLGLRHAGLEAAMKVVGGNCDVTIEFRGYQWLGEAKKWKGASWIWDGYQQLTTRYAAGLANQTRGGMLIYCYDARADLCMAQWQGALQREVPQSSPTPSPTATLAFTSLDVAQATGAQLKILHVPFVLHHDPQDGKRKLSKGALAAAKAVRTAASRRKNDNGSSTAAA